jgi:predicted GIY-YIG superfamily endonuclease
MSNKEGGSVFSHRYFKLAFLEEKRIEGLTREQKERLIYGE